MRDAPDIARRAIFLDALGTLIALAPPWPRLVDLLAQRHAIRVEEPLAREALLAEMRYYRAHCATAGDRSSLAALRLRCAEIVIDGLALAPARITPRELVPTLLDALRFELYDDVRPALERWRAQGLALVVVSNWDISLHDVVRATGLHELLDGVITSAQVGFSKPDPRIFAAALEHLGVSREAVLHIGDTFEEDVAGARAAGIEVLLLQRERPAAPLPEGVRGIATLLEC